MPEISVIMPVYNGERYLNNTIKQIIAQKYSDFELIIIDDGSTDDSYNICKNYAQVDSRIRIIRQENLGISAARNRGIKEVRGSYIAFLDQDDDITELWLKVMYDATVQYNSDITRVGYRIKEIDKNNNIILEKCSITDSVVLEKKDLLNDFSMYRDHFQSVWNCLYKSSVVRNSGIEFNEKMRYGGEDITFNIMLLPFVERVCKIKSIEYTHYKRTNTSTSAKFNSNRLESILLLNNIENKIIKEIFEEQDRNKWQFSEQLSNLCLLITIICSNDSLNEREKKMYLKKIKKDKMFGKIKFSLKNFFFVAGKYNKRLMAGVLFELRLWWILVILGEKRVRTLN